MDENVVKLDTGNPVGEEVQALKDGCSFSHSGDTPCNQGRRDGTCAGLRSTSLFENLLPSIPTETICNLTPPFWLDTNVVKKE